MREGRREKQLERDNHKGSVVAVASYFLIAHLAYFKIKMRKKEMLSVVAYAEMLLIH